MIRFTRRLFSSFATATPPPTPKAQPIVQSLTIIDPLAFQSKNLFNVIQNKLETSGVLTDAQRSFRDFKRSQASTRFLLSYNKVIKAIDEGKLEILEELLSPTLFKEYKKALKNKDQLPYFLQKATECKLVQARSYSESMKFVSSVNKWYQLTLQYKLEKGDVAYHVVQRNDKLKLFKFIKFYL